MSLVYNTYVAQLSNLMVISSTNADFQTFLPGCIDYAEQRIYRETDLLYTQVTDATTQVSSGNRNFAPPTAFGTYITVDQINIISPVGTTAGNGTRNPVTMVSPEMVDASYPSGQTVTGIPIFYAMRSPTVILFGPAPDAAYTAEVIGIQRPTALSSTNTSTILTTYVPDLFMAASMVFASGYMRNFGAQADNPQMSQSWETQYKTLFQSAEVEQLRAKGKSQGWTTDSPSPLAQRT